MVASYAFVVVKYEGNILQQLWQKKSQMEYDSCSYIMLFLWFNIKKKHLEAMKTPVANIQPSSLQENQFYYTGFL